jgi:hypothetical protein
MLVGTLLSDNPLGNAPPRSRRLWAWAIVAVACDAAVPFGPHFPHQIPQQFAPWFTRQAAPYTELYFTNPATLPTRLSARGPSPSRFTVVNHEGRERVFAHVVTLAGPHGSSVVERGTVDLGDNMEASMLVNVFPTSRRTVYLTTATITDPLDICCTEYS